MCIFYLFIYFSQFVVVKNSLLFQLFPHSSSHAFSFLFPFTEAVFPSSSHLLWLTVFLSPCFPSAAGRSWAAEARRRTSAASAPSHGVAASTRRVLPPSGHEWDSMSPSTLTGYCLYSMAAWGPWPSHWARVSARTSGCWGTKSDQMLVRTQGVGYLLFCF